MIVILENLIRESWIKYHPLVSSSGSFFSLVTWTWWLERQCKFHGFVKLRFHRIRTTMFYVLRKRKRLGEAWLQARRNDRKLLKTVSKCSHSDTYANSFPGCNFLFSFRTSTLLLLIKDEEPSGHSDLSKRRFTDREENYFFFHSKKDI